MKQGPSVPILRRRDGSPRIVLTLRTWLLGSHLAVFLLPVLVLIGSGALSQDLRDQTRWDLEHQAAILSLLAHDLVSHQREHDPAAGLADVGEVLSARLGAVKVATLSGIRVVDAAGVVVASSAARLDRQDLSTEVEVQRALAGRSHVVVRPREAARVPLDSKSRRASVRLFVAVPIELDGEVIGAVVISRTPREELQTLYEMAPGPLLGGAVAALLLTLGGGLAMGFLLSGSLSQVARGTTALAEGRFGEKGSLEQPRQSHVRDVAQLAQSVSTMAERLQQRLGYIGEFASNVSHEFKTPLATLRGTVELLVDDDGSMAPEQRARFLANAEAELTRMQKLVDGLLTLARAEEGGVRESVDLDVLIQGVASRHGGVSAEGGAGRVEGSRSQLEAVLDNLVGNALRYGAPPVEIRAERTADEIAIQVTDAGPGISSANAERVFDRFFTTARDDGGTGLGLALVRTVVEQHGGTIRVESAPGRTCFEVRLPVEDSPIEGRPRRVH